MHQCVVSSPLPTLRPSSSSKMHVTTVPPPSTSDKKACDSGDHCKEESNQCAGSPCGKKSADDQHTAGDCCAGKEPAPEETKAA